MWTNSAQRLLCYERIGGFAVRPTGCLEQSGYLTRLNNLSPGIVLQVKPTFSNQEMQRRLQLIRHHMEANAIDACVFTSYHNVHYFSDFLYCYFGRPYAFIVTANKAMSVSAGKDASNYYYKYYCYYYYYYYYYYCYYIYTFFCNLSLYLARVS